MRNMSDRTWKTEKYKSYNRTILETRMLPRVYGIMLYKIKTFLGRKLSISTKEIVETSTDNKCSISNIEMLCDSFARNLNAMNYLISARIHCTVGVEACPYLNSTRSLNHAQS